MKWLSIPADGERQEDRHVGIPEDRDNESGGLLFGIA